jgi:hypothetical protein
MVAETESLLIKPISVRQFELYALSLERGPNFEPASVVAANQVGRGKACGGILLDQESGTFGTIAMRRRVDHCWIYVAQHGPSRRPNRPWTPSASICVELIRLSLFRPVLADAPVLDQGEPEGRRQMALAAAGRPEQQDIGPFASQASPDATVFIGSIASLWPSARPSSLPRSTDIVRPPQHACRVGTRSGHPRLCQTFLKTSH